MNQSYVPSLLDLQVFELLAVAPPGDLFHAVRFFNHINSFSSSERKQFKSTGKTLESFGCSASAASKPAAKKNDDDFDLFEDEPDEDSEEKKRITEERLKAYNAKKSNSNI